MSLYGDFTFNTFSDKGVSIKGVDFPAQIGNTGGLFSTVYDLLSVKAGLIQLILTRRGERVMMPDFGTDVRESIFQPLNDTLISTLHKQIISAINKYAKNIIVQDLNVIPNPDNHTLSIKLVFSVKGDILNRESITLSILDNGFSIT